MEDEELEKAKKGIIPSNSQFNTTRAMKKAWALQRNEVCIDDPVPADLMQEGKIDANCICRYLYMYALEICRQMNTAEKTVHIVACYAELFFPII